MDDHDIQEWSRHYDSVVWTINTIFLAGIGTVLVYSYSQPEAVAGKPPAAVAPAFGLSLVFFVLFYVSGFRMIRRGLHTRVADAALRQFLGNPYQRRSFSQWNVYCLYMFVMTIAFTERLVAALHGPCAAYIALGLANGSILALLWRRGRSAVPSGGVGSGNSDTIRSGDSGTPS